MECLEFEAVYNLNHSDIYIALFLYTLYYPKIQRNNINCTIYTFYMPRNTNVFRLKQKVNAVHLSANLHFYLAEQK